MAFINFARREIAFKIVYYGPALCGKTTNLEQIHQAVDPDHPGRIDHVVHPAGPHAVF